MGGYITMDSRGRMLEQAHWSLPFQYTCVDIVNNTKILEYQGIRKHHNKLPDISNTKGTAYISIDKNGIFHQLRIHDYSGHRVIDIDYGFHKQFGNNPTLHIHFWKGSKFHGDPNTTRLFNRKDFKKYNKYLKGIIKDEWIN